MKRILVTGSSGRIGRAVVRELLTRQYDVIGYDRLDSTLQTLTTIIGDLQNVALLDQATTDVDTLIHLAATPDDSHFPPVPGDNNFLSELVPNNIVGSYQVLEAARRANIRRVILASTGQVIDGHIRNQNFPVVASANPLPRYLYSCTKIFLESLGRVYSQHHNMNVLSVRLGWCPRDIGQVQEIASSPTYQDRYLSPGDAGRFFALAVEAKLPQYSVVYAFSKHCHQMLYDPEPARAIVGFEAQDQWPTDAELW